MRSLFPVYLCGLAGAGDLLPIRSCPAWPAMERRAKVTVQAGGGLGSVVEVRSLATDSVLVESATELRSATSFAAHEDRC